MEIAFSNIVISLSQWIFMYLGLLCLRLELHHWVNTIVLSVVYPMYLWYMSKNNVLWLIDQGSMFAVVIGAGLFMTLLLESGVFGDSFEKTLKKSLKEYGRDTKATAMSSTAIACSIAVGICVSYIVRGPTFMNVQ